MIASIGVLLFNLSRFSFYNLACILQRDIDRDSCVLVTVCTSLVLLMHVFTCALLVGNLKHSTDLLVTIVLLLRRVSCYYVWCLSDIIQDIISSASISLSLSTF